jgi:prophage maintenance system killer protein
VRWLSAGDVLVIAGGVLGMAPEELCTRVDLVALQEAVEASRHPEPEDVQEAAARLFAALATSDAVAGAGLRVGWLAACQLLALNDAGPPEVASPEVLRQLLKDVASGRSQPADLAAWLPHDRRKRMFERFTSESRAVLSAAEQEARDLHHDFIGTEHVLVALLTTGRGPGYQALTSFGVEADSVRHRVRELIGAGDPKGAGKKPRFTPRSKKVLELSLREALRLGDRNIGTEHLLLALLREGEGVGAVVLEQMGVSLDGLRRCVLRLREELHDGTRPAAADHGSESLGNRLHADIDALVQRNAALEAEVARLRGILANRGIDPGTGEMSA